MTPEPDSKREGRRAASRRWRERHREQARAEGRRRNALRTPEQRHRQYLARREAHLAYQRQWRQENAERARSALRAWRRRNAETFYAQQSAYLAARPDVRAAQKARHLEWLAENSDRVKSMKARRRAMEREAFREYVDIVVLRAISRGRCGICGEPVVTDETIDHIVPIIRGGLHEYLNCQLAHRVCNSTKRDRLPGDMKKAELTRLARLHGADGQDGLCVG